MGERRSDFHGKELLVVSIRSGSCAYEDLLCLCHSYIPSSILPGFIIICCFSYKISSYPYRGPKLRILDLRQDTDCRITCPEVSTKTPSCFYSCAYSDRSITKIERQLCCVNAECKTLLPRPVELLVDLSLDGSLMEKEFLVLLMYKIEESLGSLHVCCRDLQIDKLCKCKCTLKFLDLKCIDQLSVDRGSLSDITSILCRMIHLESLSLSNVTFRSLSGKVFKIFLSHLQRMEHLKELSLSSFCLKNHLDRVLR